MLTVSVVTYHQNDDEIRSCLSRLSQSQAVDRIYVIDNGSERRVADICAPIAKVSYASSRNVGYGAANNIAMRRAIDAGADYHIVINTDIDFDPASLATLIDYMDHHRDVAALHPKIVNPDGSLQYTARLLPWPAVLFCRRFLPRRLFSKMHRRYLMKHRDHDTEFEAGYIQGSFMLIRVDALRLVGLFDERFFMYPEDIDLSRRLAEAGRIVCSPIVTMVHRHQAASYQSARMLRIHIVNMIHYFNKWGWIFDAHRRRLNQRLSHD